MLRARGLANSICLVAAFWVAFPAASYYEDNTASWAGWSGNSYSTFHYDLTRKLALGAGFSLSEAELIASVDAAVDVGTFQGEFSFSPLVVLSGTPRFGALHTYYHFPRRGLTNLKGDAYPSATDSCSYFTAASGDQCPGGVPEINTLDGWAVLGTAVPDPVPTISVNGSASAAVAGRTLHSLGIYLHSLADSYSHEECMRLVQKRDHTALPPQACQLSWHDLEYGADPPNAAVPYTRFAGRAVWEALLYYRRWNAVSGTQTWDQPTAASFVDSWAALFSAANRRALAAVPAPTSYFALTPCRIVDTRNSTGADAGWPALDANATRSFSVTGKCAIPASAATLSVNVTVTGPSSAGELVLFRGDLASSPPTSSISFKAGTTRANIGVLSLSGDGTSSFQVTNRSSGPAHFILDVNGYLQ